MNEEDGVLWARKCAESSMVMQAPEKLESTVSGMLAYPRPDFNGSRSNRVLSHTLFADACKRARRWLRNKTSGKHVCVAAGFWLLASIPEERSVRS